MRFHKHCRAAATLLIAGSLLVLIACQAEPTQQKDREPEATKKKAEQFAVRVVPSQLFQGDTERLAPHLDLDSTVCVKVEFRGKELPFKLQFVVWHNGKVERVQEAHISSLSGPTEITFSLKQV